MRDTRAVIHVGIAYPRVGENVPTIPGECAPDQQFYVPVKRPMLQRQWNMRYALYVRAVRSNLLACTYICICVCVYIYIGICLSGIWVTAR